MNNNNKRTTVNLELPKEYKEALEKEAKENEMSLSGLIRLIIKKHLLEKTNDSL